MKLIKKTAKQAIWAAALIASAFMFAPVQVSAQQAPTPVEKIMLTDLDINWEYEVIGPVNAVVHQTSLITKRPIMQELNDALRAEAAKVGADAVVKIQYEAGSPFNKKGFRAAGTAVRFRQQPEQYYASTEPPPQAAEPVVVEEPAPVTVDVPVPPTPGAKPTIVASAPRPAYPPSTAIKEPEGFISTKRPRAPQPGAPTSAPRGPVIAMAPTAPAAPRPPRPPTPAAMIILSDQDIAYRPYTVLGDVSAVVHQTSLLRKIPIRVDLDNALRAEAAKLGADAVVMIQYEDGSPLNKKGFRGAGKAVKFR